MSPSLYPGYPWKPTPPPPMPKMPPPMKHDDAAAATTPPLVDVVGVRKVKFTGLTQNLQVDPAV
jgi:hypothetical protein